MQEKKDILWRIYLIGAVLFVFATVICIKVLYIQIAQGNKWRAEAQKKATRVFKIKAERGNIYSSDGSLLMTSYPIYELRWDSRAGEIPDTTFDRQIDELAAGLSNILGGKSKGQYKAELIKARKKGHRYHLVKAKVTYTELKKVKKLPLFNLGKHGGGLIAIGNSKREKPYGNMASRTIGSKIDGRQAIGLEGKYDSILRGKDGRQTARRISGGGWKVVESPTDIEPMDGYDIVSTIDINIQDVAESALRKQLIQHNCDYGTAVLMEVSTGEIKAIANLKKLEGKTNEYSDIENIAVKDKADPGSTFKLLTAMALLESGAKVDDSVNTAAGKFSPCKDFTIKDSHEGGYGTITLQRAFEVSSNVAFAKLALKYFGKGTKLGPKTFIQHLYKTGIHQPLNIDIPGEPSPLVKNIDNETWSCLSLPQMAIGYELDITPLQMLTIYNAVANDGKVVKPRFVKYIQKKGQIITAFQPQVITENICSKETIAALKGMMEGVVQHKGGTANNLRGLNYTAAGKTGTAQIALGDKGYQTDGKRSYRASFVGYFPADKPLYSCIVVITNPSEGQIYGNVIAGPVFKEIADKVYSTSLKIHHPASKDSLFKLNGLPLAKATQAEKVREIVSKTKIPVSNIKETSEWIETIDTRGKLSFKERTLDNNKIPDLKGMGLRDALYLLENAGLKAEIKGKGKVKKQHPLPGEKLIKGEQITIELS